MTTSGQVDQLRNVFWIGGATAAGKSTAADMLAERHGTGVYHFDRQEPFHIHRSIPEEQPNLIRFMGQTMDERWVLRSPESMVTEVVGTWTERFSMVLTDLTKLVQAGPVIAEGAGFFPSLMQPLLTDIPHAVWLIPSTEFQRCVRDTRGITVADNPHISDRERAYNNLLARDGLLAARLRREAEDFGLPVISVDASTVASVSKLIEPYVEVWLQTVV
jgi:hypothetical protein